VEPLSTFCLSALLFLSLPLPLFAGAAIKVYPLARRSLMPWLCCSSVGLGVMGLLIIATPLAPLAELVVGCTIFFDLRDADVSSARQGCRR